MKPLKCAHCNKMHRLAYVRGGLVADLIDDVSFTVILASRPRVYVWEIHKNLFALFDQEKYLKKVLAYAKTADELECPVCGGMMQARAMASV